MLIFPLILLVPVDKEVSHLQFISLLLWSIASRNLAYISPTLFFMSGLVLEYAQHFPGMNGYFAIYPVNVQDWISYDSNRLKERLFEILQICNNCTIPNHFPK